MQITNCVSFNGFNIIHSVTEQGWRKSLLDVNSLNGLISFQTWQITADQNTFILLKLQFQKYKFKLDNQTWKKPPKIKISINQDSHSSTTGENYKPTDGDKFLKKWQEKGRATATT